MIETDVCIIGAGPSGVATSLMLSNLKIKHHIIDKAIFPRDKTCGDGLILYAYKAMKLLGGNLFEDFLKSPKFLHSKKIKLHVNNTTNIEFKESEDRDMLITYAKRLDFDHFLVEHLSNEFAVQDFGNGVKSLEEQENGILVTLKNGKKVLANVVVGADGAQSIVARKLAKYKPNKKLVSTFVSAYFDNVEEMPINNEAEVRVVYKGMPLFFYIFPLANGQVNVSLGGRSDNIIKNNINLIDEVEAIIENHVKVNYKFKNAVRNGKWRGWSIPFHFGSQQIFGSRFLLVGDAAGLANAFYKEGVGTGMMSGIIAAKNIEKCLNETNFSKEALQNYEKEVKKEFGRLLKFSHLMLKVSRFKNIFPKMVGLVKFNVEKRLFSSIKKRSY